MLKEFDYDSNLNPNNFGVPDPEVTCGFRSILVYYRLPLSFKEFCCDPNLNPPNNRVPDPEVTNSDLNKNLFITGCPYAEGAWL
jgi:hypothetical protein